jgi:hypothetical protein
MAFFNVGEPYLSRWISLRAAPKVERAAPISSGGGHNRRQQRDFMRERLV